MPRRLNCCVYGCDSTNEYYRLYTLPKSDRLREFWIKFLRRNNPTITNIPKSKLRNMYVCERHFEKKFLKPNGKRIYYARPTLLTQNEISLGIPLQKPDDNAALFDHTYANTTQTVCCPSMPKTENVIENTVAAYTVLIDHNYANVRENFCTTSEKTANVMKTKETSMSPLEEEQVNINVPTSVSGVFLSESAAQTECSEKTDVATAVSLDILKKHRIKKCIKKIKKNIPKGIRKKPFAERCLKGKEFLQVHSQTLAHLNPYAKKFISMQLKLASIKRKEAHRYTLSEKMLAFTLLKESPKGYRFLEKIFRLPSRRTLLRLSENVMFGTGINDKLFEHLTRKIQKWDDKKKICSIVFDEVALMPHLNYFEKTDHVVGFVDIGGKSIQRFCEHALVFMIRGVVSSWRQVIGFYFCEKTVGANDLKIIIKKIVESVTKTGLEPIALVCDQGSTFRTALNSLQTDTRREQILNNEKTDDSIKLFQQTLYVVYDPPHLIKGVRNNFLNKKMWFKGKWCQWSDIVDVYQIDCQLSGDRMLPKLNDEHINPKKIKKMKVSNCTKVLSARTAAVLEYTSSFRETVAGRNVSPTMKNTSEAVGFFDRLFDSVNGSQHGYVRGKLRGPVTPVSEHSQFWPSAIQILRQVKFLDEHSKTAKKAGKPLLKTVPSLISWIKTLESFQKISKLLFSRGVKYFYPRNVNQDPLENFFGRVRALNFRNTNPDPYTFSNTVKSLLLTNMLGPHSKYSNCEEDEGDCILNLKFLFEKQNAKNVDLKNMDKENIDPNIHSSAFVRSQSTASASKLRISEVITEKVNVQSSAFTAGYVGRKLNNKFKCNECKKLYTSENISEVHKWITLREYKSLKFSNLVYPNTRFIVLYRDCVLFTNSYLNRQPHTKKTGQARVGLAHRGFRTN